MLCEPKALSCSMGTNMIIILMIMIISDSHINCINNHSSYSLNDISINHNENHYYSGYPSYNICNSNNSNYYSCYYLGSGCSI